MEIASGSNTTTYDVFIHVFYIVFMVQIYDYFLIPLKKRIFAKKIYYEFEILHYYGWRNRQPFLAFE